MGISNTILQNLTKRNIDTFRHYAKIHMIRGKSKDDKYRLRLDNGSMIGRIEESNGSCLIHFFDSYDNRLRFSYKTNDAIDKVKSIAQRVKSGKVRSIKNFEPPKYYTTPKIIRSHKTTRIFQPINLAKGEYREITNKEISGRIITGYRKMNIYSGESDKWQYKVAA